MNYRMIDRETYCRKGVFRHFSEDCNGYLVANVFRLLQKEIGAFTAR